MAIFPLIQSVETYRPNTIDMMADQWQRTQWLNIFSEHTVKLPQRIKMAYRDRNVSGESGDVATRADQFADQFGRIIQQIQRDPLSHGEISILSLCAMRQDHLMAHRIDDPYLDIKQNENRQALTHLSRVLSMVDGTAEHERWEQLMRHAFAGNIFDLGCQGTTEMFEAGEIDFFTTVERLPDRPWLVDDLDCLSQAMRTKTYRKAVVFIDNAGADVVLGMVPLIRQLLRQSCEVIVAANSQPALNDVIYEELVALLDEIASIDSVIDRALRGGQLVAVPSGNGLPVIDLTQVSQTLADAAVGADLLILQGMGRALETNYQTRFGCDTLKMAMVKELAVATWLGGQLYDVVCRFELADR